jgi:hypothetical protein
VSQVRRRFLAALAVAPFLLSGCGMLDTLAGGPAGTVGGSASPAPSAAPWIAGAVGSPAPSPATGAPRVSASTPDIYGFLPRAGANTPRVKPSATCAPASYNFARIDSLTVVPGATSATVSWYNLGGYHLVQFRVTAVSQDLHSGRQRDIGFTTITPTTPCGPVSATITGLDSGTHYVFSVDAVVLRRSGDGTHAATVYRSGPVRTR